MNLDLLYVYINLFYSSFFIFLNSQTYATTNKTDNTNQEKLSVRGTTVKPNTSDNNIGNKNLTPISKKPEIVEKYGLPIAGKTPL